MNRVDRLMGMLTVLQSRKFVSAEHLSEKFNISVRTVYRDIKALGEINIPVSFENNKGYFLVQGYFCPPVAFTTDEANALILLEALVEGFTDQSIKQHYDTALVKIKAVLRGVQKDTVEDLRSQIKTVIPPDVPPNNFKHLAALQQAISNKMILRLTYRNGKGEESEREIEPVGLLFYDMNWHLVAWCWTRKDYRDFKLSRIQGISATNKPFRKTKHISLNEYIQILEVFLSGLP